MPPATNKGYRSLYTLKNNMHHMRSLSVLYVLVIAVLLFGACTRQAPATTDSVYGKPIYLGTRISEDSAIDCSSLKDQMGDATEVETKVKGEVIGICPDKSCILKVDMGDGTCMNVKMNNLPISIPRDASGKTAIIQGRAYVDTTSIKMLPGYGRDSGVSVSETEATKDPEVSLVFDAKGLIIR